LDRLEADDLAAAIAVRTAGLQQERAAVSSSESPNT
jgi:hypothetical protein